MKLLFFTGPVFINKLQWSVKSLGKCYHYFTLQYNRYLNRILLQFRAHIGKLQSFRLPAMQLVNRVWHMLYYMNRILIMLLRSSCKRIKEIFVYFFIVQETYMRTFWWVWGYTPAFKVGRSHQFTRFFCFWQIF